MQEVTLRDYFAARAMQAILAGKAKKGVVSDLPLPRIAISAYDMADAMIEAREDDKEDEDDEGYFSSEYQRTPEGYVWKVLFIGGPRHGEVCQVIEKNAIKCEGGFYKKAYLGIEYSAYKMVYIWSGMHDSEVIDFVFDAITNASKCREDESLFEVHVAGQTTKLSITNGKQSLGVLFDKQALGEVGEGLTKVYNDL